MTLGERIKECRQNVDLSQEKVAELVGVSRQAVTKWEANQTAPSTENLFKLAEIFGTTVDFMLTSDGPGPNSPAEQIYYLQKMEQEKAAAARRDKWKRNFMMTGIVAGGYLLLYLLGRILYTESDSSMTVMGWLFGTDPQQLAYLFGWLLDKGFFLYASLISIIPALFGKYHFSLTTFTACTIGLLLGEPLGNNPAGAAYGHGHYGWAIWLMVFLFSVVMGILLERHAKKSLSLKDRKIQVWCGVAVLGIIAIIIFIRLSMPSFGSV